MLLIGQFFNRATVIRFNKVSFHAEFKLEIKSPNGQGAPFSEMNEILSVAQSSREPDALYACGYKWKDPETEEYSNAVTMKMKTNGQIEFLDVWVANETKQRDSCRSVFFDESNNVAIFMMEVVRPTYKDVLVVPMSSSGGYDLGAFNIEYGFSPIDFRLATHAAFELDGQYYFGGFSKGFNTKIQKIEQKNLDSHLFRIHPQKGSSCLFMSYESAKWVKDQITRYQNSAVSEMYSIQFIRSENKIAIAAYHSDKAMATPLSNNIKKPKMCADFSSNVPDVEFYGGSNKIAYAVNQSDTGAQGLVIMNQSSTWLFENGTTTDGVLGSWN